MSNNAINCDKLGLSDCLCNVFALFGCHLDKSDTVPCIICISISLSYESHMTHCRYLTSSSGVWLWSVKMDLSLLTPSTQAKCWQALGIYSKR